MIDAGETIAPGVGSDIAKPGDAELAYPGTPLEAALSLFEGVDDVAKSTGDISCPVLVFTSRQDHVVPPSSSDLLASLGERARSSRCSRAELSTSRRSTTTPTRSPSASSSSRARTRRARAATDGYSMTEGRLTWRKGTELTREDAAYVARLARIDLERGGARHVRRPARRRARSRGAGGRARHVERRADAHPLPLVNVLRDDEPQPSLDRDEVLVAGSGDRVGALQGPAGPR